MPSQGVGLPRKALNQSRQLHHLSSRIGNRHLGPERTADTRTSDHAEPVYCFDQRDTIGVVCRHCRLCFGAQAREDIRECVQLFDLRTRKSIIYPWW
jgi:hypothetical protein